ncbi:hypothetical protein ACG1BZ_15745 [Microbulbifer sp. CNSA002]|uniref:hypothetical protein n=1 Tax=unclassified Microbulbifer TaxID=2619833 RepID=UPI0039B5BB18
MNPYKAPESDIELEKLATPTSIKMVYLLIALSFLIFLIEEFIYVLSSETGIFDPFNYIFIPIWGAILLWVSGMIRKRTENPKSTFLILAIVVAGMSILTPLGAYSLYTGIGEASCFLAVYYLLNKRAPERWFKPA